MASRHFHDANERGNFQNDNVQVVDTDLKSPASLIVFEMDQLAARLETQFFHQTLGDGEEVAVY